MYSVNYIFTENMYELPSLTNAHLWHLFYLPLADFHSDCKENIVSFLFLSLFFLIN